MKKLSLMLLIFAATSSFIVAQSEEKGETKEIPEAYIFIELGNTSEDKFIEKFEAFRAELKKDHSRGYIVNYGKPPEVSKREKQIIDNLNWRCDYDCPRLTLVNGGDTGELKTVFWIVPLGAEPPKP